MAGNVSAYDLKEFVKEMNASGFAAALARHRIEGALIAPPATPRQYRFSMRHAVAIPACQRVN